MAQSCNLNAQSLPFSCCSVVGGEASVVVAIVEVGSVMATAGGSVVVRSVVVGRGGSVVVENLLLVQ